MRIYFFGSINGGVQDIKKWYRPFISHLKNYGEVLSEDIFFNPTVLKGVEDGKSSLEIFRSDIALINCADVLVGDITIPSHGVGWEIRHAQGVGKLLLCLHRLGEGREPSPMFLGNPGLFIKRYATLDEAKAHIDRFFAWFATRQRKTGWFSRFFG